MEFNTFGVSPLIFGVVAEKEQLGTPWPAVILEIDGYKPYNPFHSANIRRRAVEFVLGGIVRRDYQSR